jgi:ABC-type branched-subunit amino acid transport system substrate-binding protein
VRVGLLFDFPQRDGGDSLEDAIRLGLDSVAAFDGDVEFVREARQGHPTGSADDVVEGFRQLAAADVDIVIGPSISDNAIAARDAADSAELASINYSGGERTRSSWMFHYQVGSLEEEPPVLIARLAERGYGRIGVIHDASIVGDRYRECLGWAAPAQGLDIVASVAISPVADDVADAVATVRAASPDALVYLGLGAASHNVALALDDWKVPVVANSALMFGYAMPDWRDAWAGWEYIDTIADDNQQRATLAALDRRAAGGPIGCAAYDMGRLLGEAHARADRHDRAGLREGLERVKQLPASSGYEGTLIGFGVWDRAALKGHFLVLREWRDGKTVQVER